ncbi:MAG: molybdopterin oxidoreductase [Desulfobacteraceae bacterium]|nr:MAG: molybdopterin oxidoreductase [Desulfobacteraceae bacterium]
MSKEDIVSEITHIISEKNISRRGFIKCAGLLGGTIGASSYLFQFPGGWDGSQAHADGLDAGDYVLHLPENQLFSACQQCNTNCGIKVKVVDGMVKKIDGNPYSPWNMTPQIAYTTARKDASAIDGSLCPKGQAGIQTLYDPFRIVKVLKRTGKRISFEKAITEIAEGGDLFGEVHVEGLKDICVLKDQTIAKQLAEDSANVAAKKMTLAEFKTKHAVNLHYLIDPEHPDLGPKNNQLCFMWGRLKDGRADLLKDFFSKSLGSVNYHGHTTVCQGSLYFSGKAMSDQFVEGKWADGAKFYWQGDTGNAEFILFVGSSPYEANYGPPMRVQKITEGVVEGRLKIAVIDPRCSKTASRAWKWLPVEPINGVGAIAMGMIQWIIDNRFDAKYLRNANKAAALAATEPNWCQAAWLVKIDAEGKPGKYLRGSDLGLATEKRPKKKAEEGQWDFDAFMVLADNQPVAFDPNDEKRVAEGDLLVDTEIKGIKVKSVLQIIRETAASKPLKQWAELAGVHEEDIVDIAREFTSHGKKAVADIHRGVSQQTSGFYNVVAWYTVNALIGNTGWQGGLSKSTTYDRIGDRPGKPINLTKMWKGGIKAFGINIIRHGAVYDKTTLFAGYPAKRNWYPFSSDIYQEIIPSMGDMYPYPIKALFLYMGTPIYAMPAGHTLVDIVSDLKKIPLFIASDILIGETSMYADYIFPDTTYLERWEFPGSHPSVTPKVFPVRQPVVAPLTETVKVFGEEMPLNVEAFVLGLAEKLNAPGLGKDVFGPGQHMIREEDLYLRMVANVAFGEKEDGSDKVQAAGAEELKLFEFSRRHLPKSVYDPERWKKVVGTELWPHVVYLLNRGGRFQQYHAAFKYKQLTNAYDKMVGLYFEKFATTTHSMTGKPYLPHAAYVPGPVDCTGRMVDDRGQGYDLTLITYKSITHTKSRTISNYWLSAILPENFVEVAAADAKRLGLRSGDQVKVVSASNPEGVWNLGHGRQVPMIGKVKVIEGLRPGTVAFSHGHGHWAYSSGPITIDGFTINGDGRRGMGIHANAAMRVDPVLKNTTLCDTVGGSAVFYNSQVKLLKV